jgi:predicted Zn-dependent protease
MFKRLLLLCSFFVVLGGCSTNPATGDKQFTAFMSPAQERQIGAQEHQNVLKEFGLYDDKRLQKYVSEVGNKVTARTERTDVNYQFFLLDSPIVNAFALPGGYIYLTRGTMALAGSEAEIAAVLGHEAGHVTARHSAERYSQGVATSIGASILSVAIDSSGVSQALGVGSDLYLKSYSRSQENQADTLGIRYLGHAGYDTQAMTDFLMHLQADSALENKLEGDGSSKAINTFFSTHPATAERVNKTKTEVQNQNRGSVGHEAYLKVIDGMIYGDSAAQGLVRGSKFVHPEMGFMFSVPEDYRLYNSPAQVVAKGTRASKGGMIVFDMAGNAERATPMRFLRDIWLKGQAVEHVEDIMIGGMKAATASIDGSVNGKTVKMQLVAVRWSDNQIARFQVILPYSPSKTQLNALKVATYSFRKMSEKDLKAYGPYRIRIVKAGPRDNLGSMAKKMVVDDYKEERFRVLNGLRSNEEVKAGQMYKIIAKW